MQNLPNSQDKLIKKKRSEFNEAMVKIRILEKQFRLLKQVRSLNKRLMDANSSVGYKYFLYFFLFHFFYFIVICNIFYCTLLNVSLKICLD